MYCWCHWWAILSTLPGCVLLFKLAVVLLFDHYLEVIYAMSSLTVGDVTLRTILPEDGPVLADIVKTTLAEFGGVGPGFASSDSELNHFYDAYTRPRSIYYVLVQNGEIVGGGGIAQLDGLNDPSVCELKKFYFRTSVRGKGIGTVLATRLLEHARDFGYKLAYLETLNTMNAAMHLYEKLGFQRLEKPMGNTGHCGCDRWYTLQL